MGGLFLAAEEEEEISVGERTGGRGDGRDKEIAAAHNWKILHW